MKRIVLWLLSTVSVLVLLFGYHTSTVGAEGTGTPPAIVSGAAPSSATPSAGSSSSSKKSSNTSSTPSSAPASSTTTVTGDVAQTQWGPVQVELTVTDGKITDVGVPEYPDGNPRDTEINSYALPTLIQETLDQQSASIDMVSGATVTSTGYLQSLQSALDRAGL